jgi:hypothetical protein
MAGDVIIRPTAGSVTIEPKVATVIIKTTGIPGPPGNVQLITRVAGEALGGQRVVYVDADNKAYYASPDDAEAGLIVGVTTAAAAQGAAVQIRTEGEIVESSWNWTSAPIWLGANGLLTQTPPTSGVLYRVGIPLGPQAMRVAMQLIAKL